MKLSIRTTGYGLTALLCAVATAQAGASWWIGRMDAAAAPSQAAASANPSPQVRAEQDGMLRDLIALLGVAAILATGAASLYLLRRHILAPLQALRETIASMEAGQAPGAPAAAPSSEEIAALANGLSALHGLLARAQRAESALAQSDLALMLMDKDLVITAANAACTDLLRARTLEIRRTMPSFDPDRLIGQSLAALFSQPAHARLPAPGMDRPQDIRLQLGKHEIQIRAWPIREANFARAEGLGYALHWQDVSAEKAAEIEITSLIQGLGAGQFAARIPLEGKAGFSRTLAEALNQTSQQISAALTETGDALQALARQDFTHRLTGEHQGAFEALKTDANSAAETLTDMVGSLQANAAKLRSATREIHAGASDLSDRTTRQASTLEETSATTEQLSRTVADNAARAEAARSSAASAQTNAEHSAQIARSATEAMGQIVESSQRISEIISLIDDIAFQTNLLALNASVEAARAGDAGKGFAVVASEVRRLAQSAAQASAEVKTLIQSSSQSVRAGVDLVDRSALSLRKIEADVRDLSGLMQAIAVASREQAQGLEQVHVAVKQMDQITQQNAALAEETSAAIEQSEAQARDLDAILGNLRIAASPGAVSPPNAARPGTAARLPARPIAPTILTPAPSPARNLQARVHRSIATATAPAPGGNLHLATDAADDDWSEF